MAVLNVRKIVGEPVTFTISKWAHKPYKMVVEHQQVVLNGKKITESKTKHVHI